MPTVARRLPLVGAALAALVGVALLVLGLWAAIGLGPAGRAEFSTTRQTPGIELVGSTVLAHVDAPVEVTVTRADGGPVWLGLAHDADARSAVGSSPHLSVDRVHYPSGAVDVSTTGAGASKAAQLQGGDVWQQHEHRHRHRPPGREPGCRAAERRGHVRERRRTGPGPHHPGVAAPHVVLRGAGRGGPRPDHRRARPRVPAARPSPPRTAAGHGGDGTGPPGAPGRAQTPSRQQAGTSVPPQASGTGQVGRE